MSENEIPALIFVVGILLLYFWQVWIHTGEY